MEQMDESSALMKDLSQLAKLAIKGQQRDVLVFIRRLARRYSALRPELADELNALLRQAPDTASASPVLRKATSEIIPVDLDSRLSLARVEDPVHLELTPEWDGAVSGPLQQLVSERLNEAALLKADLSPTRTALFTGAPGTGKTLAARWVAERLHRPLITLDLSAVMSSFLGRTGNNVRNVLDYAKSVSCVFFLDEFDAIAKRRDDAVEVGELKRLVTVLLQEIDSWPSSGLLIAATNHEDLLDPAVWRRFETVVKFGMPGPADIRRTVAQLLKDAPLSERWLKVLTRSFSGLSYADIETIIKRARRQAVIQGAPLESRFQLAVAERAEGLQRRERLALALDLSKLGLSQRQARDWTGVSRDTIRKHEAVR
jgi:SpoVK/Ycf46/Vps4 family AAA+-type ATPase